MTARRRDEAMVAAEHLRRRYPVLRRVTAKHVRSVIREFLLAGWTLSDLAHAIDQRPTGRQPHSGANGVGNVGAWLTSRLAWWRDDNGTVVVSPSQRVAAERVELRARARARAEAEAAAAAARVPATSNAEYLAARAALRAKASLSNTPL
ncbi:hypothetical protein [Occultella kanbiaonis]|nr:hypothetical protein [Occultella kanbiaonis]